jgi:MtN3 and saliva related transmembrane protein
MLTDWIGSAAAIASTVSFAPQALKIIRSGETADISYRMYLLTVTAFTLWTLYGLLLRQWPLVVSNTLCLLMAGFILFMKALPEPAAHRTAAWLRARARIHAA